LISLTSTGQQNPAAWNDGNFPAVLYLIEGNSNPWLQKNDSIYSAFAIDGVLYASGVKWSRNLTGFGMAFWNTNEMPVKTGLVSDEPIYWGVCRDGVIWELELQSKSGRVGNTYAIFRLGDKRLEIKDNPYYSLDPVWPDVSELRIETPATNKALKFPAFMDYRDILPKFTSGYFVPEIIEGNGKLTKSKYFNSCSYRFTSQDLERGFITLKIHATPLKNSASEQVFKTYKIYWK
jgi:hypothetical protein